MLLRKHNEEACENREDCFLFVKRFGSFLERYPTNYRSGMQFPDNARERVPCHAAGDFIAHTLPLLPSAAARPLRREQVL
jgi:hypothetical protein